MEKNQKQLETQRYRLDKLSKFKDVKKPLAKKLLQLILSIYFVVVISVNIVHMVYQYYLTKDFIVQDLESSERIFGKGLGEAIWNFDEDSLQAIIKGMMEHPSMVGIKIEDDAGQRIGAGGFFLNQQGRLVSFGESVTVDINEQPSHVDPKASGISGMFWHTFSIYHESEGRTEREKVGAATIYSARKIIFERIKGGYWLLFINTMTVAIALCFTFVWVSRKYLITPISILTHAVAEFDLKDIDSPDLQIQPIHTHNFKVLAGSLDNEIGILAGAFNQMIIDLKKHVQELAETTAAKERIEGKLEIANTIQKSLRKVIGEVLGGLKPDYSFEWLVPHMVIRDYKKGEFLFHKGDKASTLFYVKKGSLKLVEIDQIIGEGSLIGETGVLSPLKERTVSVVCEEDCEMCVMDEDKAIELFYKDPSALFELVRVSIRRSLENLKNTVAEKERIENDLRVAHDIQMAALPRSFPAFPDREDFEIFASMEAARDVGGDFYDFFLISEDKLCFIIGDVSGKGVPSALFMMIVKTLLKTVAMEDLSPDEILFRVNNIIASDNDTSMFVTILCAILDTQNGTLHIGNAGHNPPLICKQGQGVEFIEIPPSFLLGLMEDMRFSTETLVMTSGDIIFFYTDGVTEAMNPKHEQFSEERLQKALTDLRDDPITEIITGMNREVRNFAGGSPQSDDITMLALTFFGNR